MSTDLPSPLAGIRVLELSRVLAGPYLGRLMSDLGADVVKVEPPEGDVTRNWGGLQVGIRSYFLQWNLGKRGLCVDLNQPGGAQLVRELASKADVLVENFRPHVMARYGLDYETLARHNPSLVMASISGFGADSPHRHRGAYAPVIHAETGLLLRQVKASQGDCVDVETSMADTTSSLHTLVAVLSALLLRKSTGQGQHIDMAMIDAQVATDDIGVYELDDSLATRPLAGRVWELGDGQVLIATDVRLLWRSLSAEFGLVDPTPKGAHISEKARNRRDLMIKCLRELPSRAAFVEVMKKYNLQWGDVRETRRMNESEAIAHRGMVTQVTDPNGDTRPALNSPYRFSAASSRIRGYAPYLGEHNAEVLEEWLDMPEPDIQALADTGALLQGEQPEAAMSTTDKG